MAQKTDCTKADPSLRKARLAKRRQVAVSIGCLQGGGQPTGFIQRFNAVMGTGFLKNVLDVLFYGFGADV